MFAFSGTGRRDDYIAEIQVVFSGDKEGLPEGEGWELVEKSVEGKSANLNKARWSGCLPSPAVYATHTPLDRFFRPKARVHFLSKAARCQPRKRVLSGKLSSRILLR